MSKNRNSPTVYSPVHEVDVDAVVEEVRKHGVGNNNPFLTRNLPLKKNYRTPSKTRKVYPALPPSPPRKGKGKAVHWAAETADAVPRTPPTKRGRGAAAPPSGPPAPPRKAAYGKRKASGGSRRSRR